MLVGDRLRAIREAKKLFQGDIEERSGLKRSYVSRVENGHTIPSVETLEKLARALEVPLYQLFYEGEKPPWVASSPEAKDCRGNRLGQFRQRRAHSEQAASRSAA